MGQDASKGEADVKGARYVQSFDAFKRRVGIIRPPLSVMECTFGLREGFGETSNFISVDRRILRSVISSAVCWNGQKLLPEQWMSALGNQEAFVYVFDPNVDCMYDETLSVFQFCLKEARESSPDAKIYAVEWRGDKLLDVEERIRINKKEVKKRKRRERMLSAQVDDADEVEEEEEEEGDELAPVNDFDIPEAAPEETDPLDAAAPQLPPINYQELAAREGVTDFLAIDSFADIHPLECILAENLVPMELSRPLYSLMFDQQETCAATETCILDSSTMLPLLCTADGERTVNSPVVKSCLLLRTSLRRIAKSLDATEVNFVSLNLGNCKFILGWACRPYAYVTMVVPSTAECGIGDAMLETNMEGYSLHYGNVVNNTTLRKSYERKAIK